MRVLLALAAALAATLLSLAALAEDGRGHSGATRDLGPDPAVGVWRGWYDCRQGRTGLTLVLRRGIGAGIVEGEFIFYAVPENPRVPTGCFRVDGASIPPHDKFGLFAGDWLLRPDGYVTVDLYGGLRDGGRILAGQIQGPGCGAFRLERDAPQLSDEERRCAHGDVSDAAPAAPAAPRVEKRPI